VQMTVGKAAPSLQTAAELEPAARPATTTTVN
jgi:hypothetical protein